MTSRAVKQRHFNKQAEKAIQRQKREAENRERAQRGLEAKPKVGKAS